MKKMLTIISLLLLSSSVYAQSGMELQSRPFRNLGTMNAYADSARFIFPDTTLAKASYKILPFDMTDGQFLEIDGMTGESAYQRFLQKVKGTSWYKDEGYFPRRGVIELHTAGTDSVIILDTTVSPIDTFMVFVSGSTNMLYTTSAINDFQFLDGVLYVGGIQLPMIDFIKDQLLLATTGGFYNYNGNIDDRNSGKGILNLTNTPTIINSTVNAVSVIRDPEGATDSFGRRLPIVSVETAGGNSTSNAGITAFYDAVVATYTPDNSVLLSSGDHFSTVLWTAPRSYFVWEYAVQTRSADVASLGNDESWGSDQTKSEDLPFADTVTFGAVSALSGQSVVDGVSPVAFVGTSAGAFIAHAKRNDNANGITIDLSTTHNIARSDTLAWDLGSVNGVFNNPLTNNNAVTFVDGKIGQAANFVAASSQSLTKADGADLTFTTAMSVSAWIYRDIDSGALEGIVSKRDDASAADQSFMLYIVNNDALGFNVTIGSTEVASGGGSISTGRWHHVMGVYDGSAIYTYLDGVEVGTASASGSLDDSTEPLFIGASSSGGSATGFFDGKIDNVVLWSRALSQDEISFLYNRGVVANGNLSDYLGANDVDYASADPNSNTFTFGNQDTTYHTTTSGLPLARIPSAGGNITDAHVIASGDSTAIYQATSTKTKIYQPDLTVQQLAQDKGVEFARPVANIKRFVSPSNLHLFDAVVDSAGYGDYTQVDQAIDAGAKSIFVKNGTYSGFTADVAGLYIVGESDTLTVIDGGITANAISIRAGDMTFENLAVKTTSGGGTGFDAVNNTGTGSNFTIFRKVRVIDSDDAGFYFERGNAIFDRCTINDADGNGFYIDGADVTIQNCWVKSATGGTAILTTANTDRFLFIGNRVHGAINIVAGSDDGLAMANITDGGITNSGTSNTVPASGTGNEQY